MIIRALTIWFFTFVLGFTAWAGDVYTVSDIYVDATANNAIQAQTKAIQDGQLRAANILIERVTLADDRRKAGFSGVSPEDGAKMIRALGIDNEKRSANRYLGDITVSFNPAAVSAYMRAKNLRLVTTQSRNRLLVPMVNGVVDFGETGLIADWAGTDLGNALTPMQVIDDRPGAQNIIAKLSPNASMDTLSTLGQVMGIQQVLLLDVRGSGTGYTARIRDVAVDLKSARNLGSVNAPTPRDLLARVVSTLESDWKRSAVSVETGEIVVLPVSVLYRSHNEWLKVQDQINDSSLIKSASLQAISKSGALMNLTYSGDIERVRNELKFKGITLKTDEDMGPVLYRTGSFR